MNVSIEEYDRAYKVYLSRINEDRQLEDENEDIKDGDLISVNIFPTKSK